MRRKHKQAPSLHLIEGHPARLARIAYRKMLGLKEAKPKHG